MGDLLSIRSEQAYLDEVEWACFFAFYAVQATFGCVHFDVVNEFGERFLFDN